ncbi:MAG: hypothetical protein A3E01_04570 [Gammaproteobacteria bacterium RIFCSPHIGHO2_12_FULL_63_22]|nr:MAG: hypothetical protein A3E01_04570 [Gammaproteobacteria bacterium RIFCSPHIGHO2_12_FULL_63_22]
MKRPTPANPRIALMLDRDRRTRQQLAAAIEACDCPPKESERLQDEPLNVQGYVLATTKAVREESCG